MEKNCCGRAPHVMRKEKKQQSKDELDRLKQAEKKKRRLEKALATSAAIRSALEKKKQKKIEEQQRIDEEGAAIAEAVALHVLGEDTGDSCQIMLNNNKRFNPWDRSGNIGLLMGGQCFKKCSVEEIGWVSDANGSACKGNDWGFGWSLSPGMLGGDLRVSCSKDTGQGADISASLIAAQAVSSLQIADDSHALPFTGQGSTTVVINRMFGGSSLDNGVNLCNKF